MIYNNYLDHFFSYYMCMGNFHCDTGMYVYSLIE